MSPMERSKVALQAKMNDKYDEDQFSTAAEEDKNHEWLVVPDLGLQWALGRPGFALTKIFYEMGFEGASKTSFVLWLANLAIRAGGLAGMVETENAGSTEHMRWYLDDIENFPIMKPKSLEQGLEMTRDMLLNWREVDPDNQLPKVLIFDSIGGTALAAALDEDKAISGKTVGGKGKVMADAIEVIKPLLKETNTLWAVANQGKDKIHTNAMPGMKFADTDMITAAGGHALPLAAHYEVMLKKAAAVKQDGEKAGFKVKMVFMKNKLRFPMRELHYEVRWMQSLVWYHQTMDMLSLFGGDDEPFTIHGNPKKGFWCEGVGILEGNSLSTKEMYDLIHQREHIANFQKLLDIKIEPDDKLHWPKYTQAVDVAEGESIPE